MKYILVACRASRSPFSIAHTVMLIRASTREWQQRACELVHEQHALTVARVNGRNSTLSDVLLHRPKYATGGWSWVCNTAATIRQGLRKGADSKVLKYNISLNWTGPFKIIKADLSPATNQPDGRPLGDKLLYVDLPPNLSGLAAKPGVTVVRCKPCANSYDAHGMPDISRPASHNTCYSPSRLNRPHTTSSPMTSSPPQSSMSPNV